MDETDTTKITENTFAKICGLCEEQKSKYCCPKCGILYCSLGCYKSDKHLECSENFYRDWVNEELSSQNVDEESKRKMIEILKKMQNESNDNVDDLENDDHIDSDDYDEEDLHDRIKNLDINDADAIWSALTEDEKNEFEALISQGDVGSILPQWEPWWTKRTKSKLVTEVCDDELDKNVDTCPQLKNVQKLTSLTKIAPSTTVKFNIINILSSYAFIMRYFNGEIDPVEAIVHLLSICGNLESNANYDDPAIALEAVAQKCLQNELVQTDKRSTEVMKHDTYLILQGPNDDKKSFYCKAALSHLFEIFTDAKSALKHTKIAETKKKTEFSKKFPEQKIYHLPKLDVGKVKMSMKKIEYYLSFLESYSMEL
ncbi:zinc finger HIT domain-containing protein 2 [Bombyx mori]|uniref:HIT-type domain-containing protein n=1 Tax=Bombyx mori TaxID=7091 RepID=A0A8R1WLV6_BOMMO|nr:zinc finger HIT domain-containing protein 2 [Bombyx mori]